MEKSIVNKGFIVLFLLITVCYKENNSNQKNDPCNAVWSLKAQNIVDLIKIGEDSLRDLYDFIIAKGLSVFNVNDEKNPINFRLDSSLRDSWNKLISCNHNKIDKAIKIKQLPSRFQTYIYDLAEINESLRRILDELYEQNQLTKGKIKSATITSAKNRLVKYQTKLNTIAEDAEFAKEFKNYFNENSNSLEAIFKNYQEFFKKYAEIKVQYGGKLSQDQINYFFQVLGIFNVNVTNKTQNVIEKERLVLVKAFVDKLFRFQNQLARDIMHQEEIVNKISSFNFFKKQREREKLKLLKEINLNCIEMRNALQSKYAISQQGSMVGVYLQLVKAEVDVFDFVIKSISKAIQ